MRAAGQCPPGNRAAGTRSFRQGAAHGYCPGPACVHMLRRAHARACTGGSDVCICPRTCGRASACSSCVRGDAPAQDESGLCVPPLGGLAFWLTGSKVLPESIMTPPLVPLVPHVGLNEERGRCLRTRDVLVKFHSGTEHSLIFGSTFIMKLNLMINRNTIRELWKYEVRVHQLPGAPRCGSCLPCSFCVTGSPGPSQLDHRGASNLTWAAPILS